MSLLASNIDPSSLRDDGVISCFVAAPTLQFLVNPLENSVELGIRTWKALAVVHLILSGHQRACVDGEAGGVTGAGLCAGAAVERGGEAESLCRISCWSACNLTTSLPICC